MAKIFTEKALPVADEPAFKASEPVDTVTAPVIKAKIARCIYCGPNLPSGVLQRHTVFKGGIPAHLDAVIAECSAVKQLCVPIGELAATEKAIGAKGTQANTLYEEILKYARKGGK